MWMRRSLDSIAVAAAAAATVCAVAVWVNETQLLNEMQRANDAVFKTTENDKTDGQKTQNFETHCTATALYILYRYRSKNEREVFSHSYVPVHNWLILI